MLPTLDARLTAAAELVLPGKPVADIGCDHGKLTAVLAASGKYPRVIGADLRPGPLARSNRRERTDTTPRCPTLTRRTSRLSATS